MFLYTLIEMIEFLVWVITRVVIVQFVFSLLISFNIINLHNNFVAAAWKAVNVILEPLLRPIRKIMPDTGAIDFSPMVLIISLTLVSIALEGVQKSLGTM